MVGNLSANSIRAEEDARINFREHGHYEQPESRPGRLLANPVEAGLLAAPTCDDDVRLVPEDFIARHSPVGRA